MEPTIILREQNALAKFMMDQVDKYVEHYRFDFFYDVMKITETFYKERGNIEQPVFHTFHWMLRKTGTDIIDMNKVNIDPVYKEFEKRNRIIFSMKFCMNHQYFSREIFCLVNVLKSE